MPSPLRVMVVEDEFIIADEIAGIVLDAGHDVIGPFGSIEDAEAHLAKSAKPDLAILDANLRGVSSMDLAEKLRGMGVPVCLCTGYRSDDLRASFGDISILHKPVNAGALISLIRQTLDRQR